MFPYTTESGWGQATAFPLPVVGGTREWDGLLWMQQAWGIFFFLRLLHG